MPSAALERHPANSCAALRGIEAAVTRQRDGSLQLAYRIEGDLARLRIPAPRPARVADKLWQHTCCELFVAEAAGPGYHEFNFSPSGEWAAYRFTDYRQGLPLVAADPKIRLQRSAGRAIHELGERVTAFIHGHCAGSGIELPAFAHRVVADPSLQASLPEVAMGLIPGAGGTASLPARIGRHRTALLALAGSAIDAPTALAWGLVDEIADVGATGSTTEGTRPTEVTTEAG